jgi:hypothetical protein
LLVRQTNGNLAADAFVFELVFGKLAWVSTPEYDKENVIEVYDSRECDGSIYKSTVHSFDNNTEEEESEREFEEYLSEKVEYLVNYQPLYVHVSMFVELDCQRPYVNSRR